MSENDVREHGDEGVRTAGSRFAGAHSVLLYFAGAVAAVWLLTGFYQVKADQVALVERLGEFVKLPNGQAEQYQQGLHYHLPWPIDRVHVISVQQRLTMPVKAFNASPTEYEDFKRAYLNEGDNIFSKYPPKLAGLMVDAIFNPYLITADKSVVHMEANVQFRINDPEKWLTSVSHDYHETYDPAAKDDMRNQLMQQLVEKALIAQTSRLSFEKLLLGSRESLPRTMQTFVENALKIETTAPNNPTKKEEVDLGIEILRVEVTQVRPPEAVMPQYQDVLTQRVGREAKKAEAEATRTATTRAAKGEAQTDVTKAQEYATRTVQAARGEADRFSEVLKQYNNAPDLTKTNLFTEAAATVTGNAKRIFFPQQGEGVTLMVDPPEYDPNQVKNAGP